MNPNPRIHPTALVHANAELHPSVSVGPYAIIEADTVIGADCTILAHAVVGAGTRMGKKNRLHHHAVVGTDSQDKKYQGGKTRLEIGDGNVFREFATANRGTAEGSATTIGNGCLFLASSHVAHNCVVEDGVIMANSAALAGEVTVGRHAVLGGLVGVHQFCRIGAYAIVGACSKVTQDILPFTMADGHPARPRGLNRVGLLRHGFSEDSLQRLKSVYKQIFRKSASLEEAIVFLEEKESLSWEAGLLLDFIRQSGRSLARPRSGQSDDEADESITV